jgi:hypothetical protein
LNRWFEFYSRDAKWMSPLGLVTEGRGNILISLVSLSPSFDKKEVSLSGSTGDL